MPNLTLKSIPADLHERLRRRAALHGRSLNREIRQILEEAVGSRRPDAEALIARIDEFHRRVKMRPITAAEIQRLKTEGRP
jgi:plasmid stability protein